MSRLRDQGSKVSGADRGLDQGTWVPSKVAFDPEDNPLPIPIVQGLSCPVILMDSKSVPQRFRQRSPQTWSCPCLTLRWKYHDSWWSKHGA